MNLKGRYDMVRAALLLVLDVPEDTLEAINERADKLSITDSTAHLALNTLVVTHAEPKK